MKNKNVFEKVLLKFFLLINEIFIFYLGNLMVFLCDFFLLNIDKFCWLGDLGMDIYFNDKEVFLDDNFFKKN